MAENCHLKKNHIGMAENCHRKKISYRHGRELPLHAYPHSRQNTQFNMYTTTSKQQEGCTFKDSHLKCFITTNFDKFHREAFARGGESR